jgi:DNA-binding transcriptional MerR regulator
MDRNRLSIDELADAAGLTRRGIRFYVQQRLLPAPFGVGRGKHYDASHLKRLRQIRELQAAGHSLEEIRRLVEGEALLTEVSTPVGRARAAVRPAAVRAATPAPLRAELWRHVRVMPGVELAFDAGRFNPTVEQLVALRDAIAATFRPSDEDASNGEDDSDSNPIEESP